MKKILFLSLFAFATLLIACSPDEPENKNENKIETPKEEIPSPALDEFVFTEQFDTLVCETTPHIYAHQYTKGGVLYNWMEIKIDKWEFFSGDVVVDMPVYVFYFVSSNDKRDYIPSGVYTSSLIQNEVWNINCSFWNTYVCDVDILTVQWVDSYQALRSCMQVQQKVDGRYDIQVWLELDVEPFFRYIHLENQNIGFNKAGYSFSCYWWKKYF